MKILKEPQLRRQIGKELRSLLKQQMKLNENEQAKEDPVSNADLAKGLKTGAANIASSIPSALNDDFVQMIKSLTAMAEFDRSNFEKVKDMIDKYDDTAVSKSDKD